MTDLTFAPSAISHFPGAGFKGIITAWISRLRARAAAAEIRKATQTLSSLDPHMQADIGLRNFSSLSPWDQEKRLLSLLRQQ